LNFNHVESQSDQDQYIVDTNEATVYHAQCAWDHKLQLTKDAMRQRECNCRFKFFILVAVYRLWKCNLISHWII
jgi:hypothetical protein